MRTLDDAITAADAFATLHNLDDSYNFGVIFEFLKTLKARAEPSGIETDDQGFIIEGAYQSGFHLIDDDAELLVVSCRKLIEFVERRSPPGVDWLAAIIRAVDGSNSLGAGVLAEKILEAWRKGSKLQAVEPAPVDMVLYCPECGLQHIDEPGEHWTNPPHRSHLCHRCGHTWRPADVPTNGVAAIKTKGRKDTPWTGVQASKAEPGECVRPVLPRHSYNAYGICDHCGKREDSMTAYSFPCPKSPEPA